MKTMNIRNEVELSYSQKISSPFLCGIIKPKILIPVGVADNICDEDFKCIIVHELTHLKNKDIFINFVITLLSIIYWFNPILLYGFHKMRQDLEISCDAKAISYLDDGKNIQYGNAIVTVLELTGNSNRLMGTTSMVMNNSEIKRRIIMISKYKKANMKNILLGAIIVVILAGIGIALNTSKSQAEIPVESQVETSVKVAGEVVRNIYNVSEERIAEIQTLPEPDGDPGSEEYNKKQEDAVFEIWKSVNKSVIPLHSKEGYEDAIGNRFYNTCMVICTTDNYTAQVTDLTFGENVYKDYKDNDKARYLYEVKLDFISSDGKTKKPEIAKGAVELVKEDGTWKVSLFDINQFLK